MDDIRKDLLAKWEENRPKDGDIYFGILDGQEIAIKNESQHPTGTYKAWHGFMMGMDYLTHRYKLGKHNSPKKFTYYLKSSGNAAMADFYFADRLNQMMGEKLVEVVCFYPKHYDGKKLGPDSDQRWTNGKQFRRAMERSHSGIVIQVDFDERMWVDDFETGETPCLDKMNDLGLDITRENSLDITEGFKPTYGHIMEDLGNRIFNPHRDRHLLVIVPFGAGILYEDCKAVIKSHGWPIDLLAISTGNRDTIADKLFDSSEIWQESSRDLAERGYTFSKGSGDRIYHATDQEISYGMSVIGNIHDDHLDWEKQMYEKHDMGADKLHISVDYMGRVSFDYTSLCYPSITAEPSGAATIGIIPRVEKITGKKYDLIAPINTGNGIRQHASWRVFDY